MACVEYYGNLQTSKCLKGQPIGRNFLAGSLEQSEAENRT